MATYIQWDLYAKYDNGKLLPEEVTDGIIEVLDDHITEWHSCVPDGDSICSFETTWNDGYSEITDAVSEYAKRVPEILFRLECHNEDEDWRQHIMFHGEDREELDASIIYEKPQRIMYDAPPSKPKLMIVMQGGSVQGVFSDTTEAADVVLVDLDLSKLDASSEDERLDTMAWVSEKLALSSSMNCLYGSAIKEV